MQVQTTDRHRHLLPCQTAKFICHCLTDFGKPCSSLRFHCFSEDSEAVAQNPKSKVSQIYRSSGCQPFSKIRFKTSANFRHQAVGQGQNLQWMQCRCRRLLFHLQLTATAFGQTDLDVDRSHFFHQLTPDGDRFVEMLDRESKCTGQPRTAFFGV